MGGGALRRVGKYEVGRTIGEGTFAKVKFAQNTESGESVAMKVVDRSSILKHKMADQVSPHLSLLFFFPFFVLSICVLIKRFCCTSLAWELISVCHGFV